MLHDNAIACEKGLSNLMEANRFLKVILPKTFVETFPIFLTNRTIYTATYFCNALGLDNKSFLL